MSTAITVSHIERKSELLDQIIIVIGGSSGIGLETAQRARAEGAKLILTRRNPEHLHRAASAADPLRTQALDTPYLRYAARHALDRAYRARAAGALEPDPQAGARGGIHGVSVRRPLRGPRRRLGRP